MTEQSHRDEMNAAIRAQRERQAVPRSLAPPEDLPPPVDEPAEPPLRPPRKSLLARLLRK